MNRHLKTRFYQIGCKNSQPSRRWRESLTQWVVVGLLAIFSWNSAYANSAYVSAIGGVCPPGPNSGLPDDQVYKADQWKFYKCECTSYVTWKLNQDGIDFKNHYKGVRFSNAKNWKNAAQNVSIPVSDIPRIGDVAWWDSSGKYLKHGHVAYVESVNADGSVNISEYNEKGAHNFRTRQNIYADKYIHFMYCPSEAFKNSSTKEYKSAENVRRYKNDYNIIFENEAINYCLYDTRYNFIAILVRALEHKNLGNQGTLDSGTVPFTDLNKPSWLANTKEIHKAYNLGKVNGVDIIAEQEDRKFWPNRNINRIEALAFTVKTYEAMCDNTGNTSYDAPFEELKLSKFNEKDYKWMAETMKKGYSYGLTIGYESNGKKYFRPFHEVPRHESVAFVNQLITQIKQCNSSQTDSYKVTLKSSGTGTGKIELKYAGETKKTCRSCSETIPKNTYVNAAAIPDSGSEFVAWESSCDIDISEKTKRLISFWVTGNCTNEAKFNLKEEEKEEETGSTPLPSSSKLPSPSNLTATKGDYEDKIHVTWTAVEGAKEYKLYRHTSPNNIISNNYYYVRYNNFYDDKFGLEKGTTYYYSVIARAQKLSNSSVPSSVAFGYLKKDIFPSINLTSSTTSKSVYYKIEGTAQDLGGNGITQLKVNGNTLSITYPSGTDVLKWSYDLTLNKGVNEVEIYVVNGLGNAKRKKYQITYTPPSTLPFVNLVSPSDNETFYGRNVKIPPKGTIEHSSYIRDIYLVFSDDKGNKHEDRTFYRGNTSDEPNSYNLASAVGNLYMPGDVDEKTVSVSLKIVDHHQKEHLMENIYSYHWCAKNPCPSNQDTDDDGDKPEPPPEPEPEKVSLIIIKPTNGKVTGSGFNCGNGGTVCKKEYDEDNVPSITLTAYPDDGYNFSGWTGVCTNSIGDCIPTINDHISVAVNFVAKPKYLLTVNITGTGSGTVTGPSINCGSDCSKEYEENTPVKLTAAKLSGSTFTGWGSDCSASGANLSCDLTMNAKRNVTAEFINTPPTVVLESPTDGAEDQVLNVVLTGNATDPEDGALPLNYLEIVLRKVADNTSVKLDCSSNNEGESGKDGSGDAGFTCTPSSSLDYDEEYIWTVNATDKGGLSTSKESRFKTLRNKPPLEATEPSHEKGVEVDSTKELVLTWKDLPADQRDPEGETVTYDVYLWKTTGEQPNGLTEPVCRAVSSPTTCSISSNLLDYGESYTWRVDGTDGYTNKHGVKNLTKGEPWIFKTLPNSSPTDLVNPSLVNGDNPIESPFKDVDPKLPIILSWEGGDDPDDGDTVAYTVEFFGDCSAVSCENSKGPATKSCTIPANSLKTEQSCSWQVTATDSYEPANVTKSEPWNFSTMGNQAPSAPTNLVLTNEDQVLGVEDKVNPKREVVFSWDASEDPEGDEITYHLYVQKEGDTNASHYEIPAPNTSQVSDPLDFGSYKWWVVAEDMHGNTAQSEELSFETLEAPSNIKLTANSGYANVLLDWTTDATGIKVYYRVLRVLHPEESETIPEFGVDDEIAKTPNSQYTDEEELPEGQYCYRVEGYIGDKIVSSSIYAPEKVCVKAGEVTLVIESTSGTTAGEVPIEMPNGGSLQISTADICMKYDPDVLQVTDVTTTAFSSGYDFKWNADTFNELGILKIGIEAVGEFGNPAVMGPGALADVSFAVKEDRGGKDYSTLEWFEASENEDLVNQPEYKALRNCITIRDNNTPVEPLGLRDGSFTVRKGSRTRDGQRTPARFYVREAYSKGDVDGDGVVGTADARMATGIGVGYYQATQDQHNAGDLNSDNKVNDADARVIAHYALHQEWLDNDKPPVESPKTRKRQRDGKDTPITFRLGDISSTSGSQVTTTLSVDNLSDMTAMNLAIAYDTAVVEKAKVKKAGLAADAKLLYYDNKEGTVRIGLNSEQPINGSGVIAEITLTLASGGSVKSTPLVIAKTNLYDMFSRDFVISALQRQIIKENGKVVLTDVEETVIERNGVEIPIEDIITVKPPVTANVYSVSGKITDKNGKAIADVAVTVGDETVLTDSTGYYAVIGLAEGEYPVTARKTSDEGYVFLEKTCKVGNNESCRLDFVADTGENEDVIGKFAVYGTVLDRDGYPIKGATVKVGEMLTTTDKVGYFAFVGVFEGQYDVTVRKGTEELAEGTCTVSEESDCKLVFNTHFEQYSAEIEPGEQAIYGVQITVIDELKTPIPGVLLQVGDKSVISDETGYGEIIELIEGEYTLTASKAGLNFQAQAFEVGNQQLWTKLVVTPLSELDAKITPVDWEKAEQGKPFSYLITVINGGSETATGVSFSYELPTGTEVVEIRGVDSQACEPVTDEQILTCQLPTLVSGETTQVEVELDVKQPNSTLVNTVHLVANEYPSVKTEVRTLVKPYLSVFCQGTPNPITMGGVLHYECDVELNDNAPTGVATQVTLEMQVPNGVELSSLKTDYGVCDSSEFPQITCQIEDLTIKNPDDTSHITLYMDVTLTDLGLLALTNQATVKAHGYVAHTSRERTKIFIPPEYKVDMVLVIDVTHSMQEEMNGVKQALIEFAEEFDASMFPLTALIVFRDEVIVKAVTTDMNLLADAIGKIEPSEGGTCPEASIEALNIAISHVKDGGIIVLATDASPYPEADIEDTTKRLRDKNVSLHMQWTGDCSNQNDQNDWNTLPTAN